MGNKTFQVLFFFILAFDSTYAAKHPVCLNQNHILQAKSVTELEEMVHPLCLKEKISLLTNREFKSIQDWKNAYQFLKMAERIPSNWAAFYKALPFLEANSSVVEDYDRAWAYLENEKNREVISRFLGSQAHIKKELKQASRTQAASMFLKRKIPFL